MKTISQRELRNDSAEVMRGVTQGMTYRVTSRGTPVATLSPIEQDPNDALTLREGSGDMTFPPGLSMTETTNDVLSELRGNR